MTTESPIIDCEAVRGAFRQWRAQQEPLAAELSESLTALSAYQSHLDAWQRQLAVERDELRQARERFATERAAAEKSQAQSFAEISTELNAARDKIGSLTSALLARTEELRALDGRRAEVATELELARAREKELRATLEELRQSREQEELKWAEELRHLRELLEQRMEESSLEQAQTTNWWQADGGSRMADNPVLGSIQEQFGKLRQQRASDRPALKKAR
ncbi:MAG: hypothetical protein WD738_11465 [Pirellulales bacterium]